MNSKSLVFRAAWLLIGGICSCVAFSVDPQAAFVRPSMWRMRWPAGYGRTSFPAVQRPRHVRLRAPPVAWLCQGNGLETPELGTYDVTGLTRLGSEMQDLVLEVAETVGYQVEDIVWTVNGLEVWKTALKRGRLPDPRMDDVTVHRSQTSRSSATWDLWPAEPLLSRLTSALATLQLPRFVQRHPELADAVLRSLLRLVLDFEEQAMEQAMQGAASDDRDTEDSKDEEQEENEPGAEGEEENGKEEDILAEQLVESFKDEWGPAVGGVRMLDSMFGTDHGMLDLEGETGGGGGYGLDDGVWQHQGWKVVPQLQAQLREMAELRRLVHSLGRRPAVDGSVLKRMPPEQADRESRPGVAQDTRAPQTVTGMELSDNLSRMLPAEALLTRSARPAARRLFLAKLAEKKLLSYQLSGWQSRPSRPRARPRFFPRQPCGPGGPIIVCLDTSWSMEGFREMLAKAVVLEAVMAAHRQQRPVHVAAFSSENNVMACGEMGADKDGVEGLLDFLGHSFKGGTDVTGALKHAMAQLRGAGTEEEGSEEEGGGSRGLTGADVLLVTDGELPNPPVSTEMLQELQDLQSKEGMTVHGLLVGRNESKPLEMICTEVHNFLCDFDLVSQQMTPSPTTGGARWPGSPRSAQAAGSGGFGKLGMLSQPWTSSFRAAAGQPEAQAMRGLGGWGSVALRAKRRGAMDDEEEMMMELQMGEASYADDDDEWYHAGGRSRNGKSRGDAGPRKGGSAQQSEVSAETSGNDFWERAEAALEQAVASAKEEAAGRARGAEAEGEGEGAQSKAAGLRGGLERTVRVLEEGLVEREAEVRLLLLAALCGEHLLLLGPPGTAKSELGRRLAGLSSGLFFQRLLTRFTTPEELFGPLSLAALEKDRYLRMTEGYLPNAKVAFLDEVFKANSAILNTLLTILNERQFDNGLERTVVPLACLVGASNELPDSEELDALYDRFLFRREVQPVSDDNILDLLRGDREPGPDADDEGAADSDSSARTPVQLEALTATITPEDVAAVEIPNDVLLLLKDVRIFLREELEIVLSDRRLLKAANMLKVSAASHGRRQVSALDCMLLQDCLWSLPEEKDAIQDWLWSNIIPRSPKTQVDFLLDGLRTQAAEALSKSGGCVRAEEGASGEVLAQLAGVAAELRKVQGMLEERVDTMTAHEAELLGAEEHLWVEPVQALSARQMLLPVARARKGEVSASLVTVLAFQRILEGGGGVGPEVRGAVLELLFESEHGPGAKEEGFTAAELEMSMKEAKRELSPDRFRQWKRQRKAASKRR